MVREEEDWAVAEDIRERIVEGLSRMRIFTDLSKDELETVAGHMVLFELGEGETLFEEGSKGYYLSFVVDGLLSVRKSGGAGGRMEITTLSSGDSIGEMAIIDDAPRSATVVAKSDTQLAVLKRSDFHNLIGFHPHIGIKVLKAIARLLSRNLRKTSTELVNLMLPVM
jgi:CRP-like cAMP-binding protein